MNEGVGALGELPDHADLCGGLDLWVGEERCELGCRHDRVGEFAEVAVHRVDPTGIFRGAEEGTCVEALCDGHAV